MSVTAATAYSSQNAASSATSSASAYRDADFMKILLAEVTTQDPTNPMDTDKMISGIQQLQQLANTSFQKTRDDIRWAQDLVGKTVNVTQMGITDTEAKKLQDKGLIPDIGYGNLDGRVESFRIVDETAYVSIGGKDYPIDNVKQVRTSSKDPAALGAAAQQYLGTTVGYYDSQSKRVSGTVTALQWGSTTGEIELTVGGKQVPISKIVAITANQ
jgi:flagellar hook assembly protein FlgD